MRAPESIPLPAALRKRAGRFHVRLKVVVAADGSSRVSILESTHLAGLDEAVLRSFSNLPWRPGQRSGKPVEIAVSLSIDDNWQAGEDGIHLKQHLPDRL